MFNLQLINEIQCSKKIFGEIKSLDVEISTDSRNFRKGQLFLALKGDNFDGASYVEDVLKAGASGIIFTGKSLSDDKLRDFTEKFKETIFVETADTLIFLQEMARARREQWCRISASKKILGITGSNGKTTTKEMVKFFLEQIFGEKVCSTRGNLNNHIGVPLSILSVRDSDEVLLIEMGTNHMGEIQALCDIAKPDAGIITNVGGAHIEFFKSNENIFKEKSSLFYSVMNKTENKGIFVLNFDNPYLKTLEEYENIISFGENAGRVRLEIGNASVKLSEETIIELSCKNILEPFNWINFVAAYLLVSHVYPEKKDLLVKSCPKFKLPNNNRTQRYQLNGKDIYLDAYNANPASMKASIESFVRIINTEKRDINSYLFVLGDMYELGEQAKEEHQSIGILLKNLGIKNAYFVGQYAGDYISGFGHGAKEFKTRNDLKEQWCNLVSKFDGIFIKASRGLALESLMDER